MIGLGAMFGAMLKMSGGAHVIDSPLLKKFGSGKTSWVLVLTGFVVAIPLLAGLPLVV